MTSQRHRWQCSTSMASLILAVLLAPEAFGIAQKMSQHSRLSSSDGLTNLEGPVFLLEPPASLVYSNSTGGAVSCSAHGTPPPDIRWVDSRGKEIVSMSRIREVSSNGSLIVLPFHPTQFRPSVHAASVRCRAANHVGVILSRECKLKPDLTSDAWQPTVVDVFVAIGNVAVLHCDVSGSSSPASPSSSSSSESSRPTNGQQHSSSAGSRVGGLRRKNPVLRVAAWLKEHSLHGGRTTVHPGGRYTMTKRGSLHIQDVTREDGYARFFCQAVHRLTGQRRTSPPARIIVTEPVSQLPPRIDHFLPSVKVRTGQATDLICAAQGNPAPVYKWYKEYDGALREIHSTGRDAHPGSVAPFRPQPKATVLHFPRASPSDAGPYVCTASSAAGEDRRRVYLEVAGGRGGSGGDTLEISLHPQQVVADAGSPVIFNCSLIGGVASRKITWLKDGQPLLSAGRVSTTETPSRAGSGGVAGAVLRLDGVRRGDQGMYQCLAAGRVSGGAPVTAGGPAVGGHYLDGGEDEEKEDNAQGSAELSLGDFSHDSDVTSTRKRSPRSKLGVFGRGPSSSHSISSPIGPELLWTFIEQTLQPGPPVSLKCSASANPPPHITWLLDGGEVRGGGEDGYSIGSYTTVGYPTGMAVISHLNITSARVMHGGLYTCVASNGVGRPVKHSAALNIYGPPSARPPRNVTAVAGSNAHLRCPVAGFPIASVSWRRTNGGVDLSRSSGPSSAFAHSSKFQTLPNGTLLIKEVEASEDAGEYSCIATDPHGHAAMASLQLHVMKPPEIAPFTFPSNLREGMRAQVSCSVISGDFPTGLTWRKDGRPLAVSTGGDGGNGPIDPDVQETRQHLFVSSLLFLRLAARHAGSYTCIASNAAATAEYTAVMEVKVAPTWTIEPQDTSILWRQQVVLHCQADGFPDPTITWMKARGSDGTDYVALGVGMNSYPSFPGLSPQYPDFSPGGGYQHYKPGLSHFPNQESMQLMPNGSLIIRSAAPEHEGYYSCKAANGIGAGLTKVIFLQVNVPAHFYEPVTNISAAAGESAVLTCQAEGDQPLRVAFTSTPRNAHIPLSPSNVGAQGESSGMHGSGPFKAVLQLTVVTRDDAGAYYCSASNTYGEDRMVIHLQVKEPPQSPGRPEVLEVGSRWANIEWTPSISSLYPLATPPAYSPNNPMLQPSASTPPVLHYILQYRMNDEISWNNLTVSNMIGADRGGISGRDMMQKAKLSSLRPASRYRLRVIAVNEVGLGPSSPETTLLTTQEAPSGPPMEVVAEATGSESIAVRWKPLLPTYSNGEILGYQIAYREVQQPSRSMSNMGSSMGSNKDSVIKSPVGRVKVRNVRGQSRTEMMISGLRPYSHYEISVRAFNGIGPGPPSSPSIAVTFAGVPGSPPSNLRCSPLSSQSLWVRWDPLPPRDRHGLLEGYKVLYQKTISSYGDNQMRESVSHGRYYGSTDPGNEVEVKRTTNLETNLHGLSRFTNYTVHILAFTSMGDGVRSQPVYCATEEDIPGPPEHIKAMALSADAVLIAWSPPTSRNGIIVRYNVYYHPLNGGSTFSLHHQASGTSGGGVDGIPKDVIKEVVFVSGNDLMTFTYEARRLKEFQRYEFWVTAVTGVGEGPSSTTTILAPTSRVPARIPAFPLRVKVRHGQTARLDCPIMGVPSPTRKWRRLAGQNKLNGVHVAGDSTLQATGPTLTLTASSTGIEGNYSCQAENPFGTDSVWWEVDVIVAPSPSRLTLRKADAETIRVQWILGDSGGSPITGFILNYKREFGEWEEKVELEPDTREYTIKGLKCGSTYHLRLAAKNTVGTSQFSATLSVTTKGSAPQIPKQEDFLLTNSTSVTMNIDAWPTGGCPLLYMVAEYKVLSSNRRKDSGSWKLISNNIQPIRGESKPKEKSGSYWEQSGVLNSDWGLWGGDIIIEEEDEAVYVVPELLPATWYALRVSAHTDAGSIRHEFLFATRNLAGEVIELPPDTAIHDRMGKNSDPRGLGGNGGNNYGGSGFPSVAFYADPGVVVPILSGIICAIAAGICIALAVRRKRYYHGYKQGEQVNERDPNGTKTLAELENQRNNEQRQQVIGYCQERDPRDQSIPTHQLYSPSPGRKGESSLSGQKSSDSASGQDYEICPYATFSLPGGGSSGREVKGQIGPGTGAMDYSMKFHTFGNQECYAGQPPSPSMVSSESKSDKKLNCPRARRKSNVGPQGLGHSGEACSGASKSPPDGLNLEISCISSQQTLPMASSSSPSNIMVGGGSGMGGRYRYAEYTPSSPPPRSTDSPSPLGHSKSYPIIDSTMGSGGGRSDSEDNSGGGRALPPPPVMGEGTQQGHQRFHQFQSSQRLIASQGNSYGDEGMNREAGSSTESAEVSPIPSMNHWTRNGSVMVNHGGLAGSGPGWRNMMSTTRYHQEKDGEKIDFTIHV